ncbi:hypothetical protein JVT61DRAFT_14889 [Boletus reticuloceps]|uniref:Glycosyltransferase n=1 Tax=Boletus reticuloceps TaxID=495285 RepID=A0A8I2YCI4_9AGAM|nr:hypothetical protein JVT61DRAFT_14889 [Boletus reticuloceps]
MVIEELLLTDATLRAAQLGTSLLAGSTHWMAPELILFPIEDIDGALCPVMRESDVFSFAFPNVNFIIVHERHFLQDWIKLLGPVRHRDVRDVLIRGSIFLHTSLTEAFSIAILEAACTGLYVVSTQVGGVPEILPQDMISFANPDEDGALPPFLFFLFFFLQQAHRFTHTNTDHPHTRVTLFYDWAHIAECTEVVYDQNQLISRHA